MDPHFDGVIFQTHAAELRRRLTRPLPPWAVLDLRPRPAFEEGHIPGAVSIQAQDLETGWPAGVPAEAEIILVGAGMSDPAVRPASRALLALKARRVVELSGGMAAWEEAGLPVERAAGSGSSRERAA